MVTRAQRPRPRALLVALQHDEVEALDAIIPTCHVAPDARTAATLISEREIDVVISTDGAVEPNASSNHLILFGSPFAPGVVRKTRLLLVDATGEEYEKPTVPAILEGLQDALMAQFPTARGARVIQLDPKWGEAPFVDTQKETLAALGRGALLIALDPPGPIAAIYLRGASRGAPARAVAWFPNDVPDRVACVRAVLAHFASIDAEGFPGILDWEEARAWATGPELVELDRLDALRAKRAAQLAELDAEERAIKSALERARDDARQGPRRLLTSQDHELVTAVQNVLRALGFEADDVDEGLDDEAARREDLRIRVPGKPDTEWEAIAEVRGYKGSEGKAADLQRIQRFARMYTLEKKRAPAKLFYIVNGRFGVPPDQRRSPLSGATEDVELFAQ